MPSTPHALLLLPLAAALASGQHASPELQNPFRGDVQAQAAGGELFRAHCAACHGARGEGASGPDLSQGAYGVGERDEDLQRIVHRGRDVMPAFRGRLSDDDIWRVVAYIRSLASTSHARAAAGDPAAGAKLFWDKGGCGGCHRVGAQGSSSGPDLTRIGVRRGPAYLRESIVRPGAALPNGYATVAVVKPGGQSVRGSLLRSDTFSVQFFDMQGNFHSYLKEELDQIAESEESLMPAYEGVFGDAELDDLVAYLSSLRGQSGR